MNAARIIVAVLLAAQLRLDGGNSVSSERAGAAPAVPDSARAAGNADMVDGLHADNLPQGSTFVDGLARKRSFQIVGDAGPADLYLPIAHFWPFRLVIVCPHAAPRAGDVAYLECIENDGRIACIGVDGSGRRVRKGLSLASQKRILSLRGGHVTLSCPGDGSRRLKVHTDGEWVQGYVLI